MFICKKRKEKKQQQIAKCKPRDVAITIISPRKSGDHFFTLLGIAIDAKARFRKSLSDISTQQTGSAVVKKSENNNKRK